MAIMGFIIVVAGRVFSDSTDMRIRSQNLLKSSAEIGKLANLIREDISQMGVKAWGQISGDDYKVAVHESVYMDANNSVIKKRDSSSYILIGKPRTESDFADSLVFRKAVFDDEGKFIAVREIAWYRSKKSDGDVTDSLFRKCREISNPATSTAICSVSGLCGTPDGDCSSTASNINAAPRVLIATNITNFKLTPSTTEPDTLFKDGFYLIKHSNGDVILPDTCRNWGGGSVDVSGFAYNSNPSGKKRNELYISKEPSENCTFGSGISSCKEMHFSKDKTYAIEFEMPYEDAPEYQKSTQFQPGIDHLSIGLRKKDGNTIAAAPNDVLFYPPLDAGVQYTSRHIEFSVKDATTACVAITAAFYSPTAYDGMLSFKDFKIFSKTEKFRFMEPGEAGYNDSYGIIPDDDMDDDEKIIEKRKVKAFELILEMAIGREERKSGTFSQKGRGIIIATPNNGVIVKE